jgi:DNA-binding CsgD family transcriptional regulator/predicted DNA-binding transcriptional regulator
MAPSAVLDVNEIKTNLKLPGRQSHGLVDRSPRVARRNESARYLGDPDGPAVEITAANGWITTKLKYATLWADLASCGNHGATRCPYPWLIVEWLSVWSGAFDGEPMGTHRIAARMGSALPSLVRWGLSPDADLVYRTLVSLDTAREGQLAHELGMAHERVRDAVRELADAGAIRRVSSTSHRAPKATGRAVWAARQPSQVVRQLHGHRNRPITVAVSPPPPVPPPDNPPPPLETDQMTAAAGPSPSELPDPVCVDTVADATPWIPRQSSYQSSEPAPAEYPHEEQPLAAISLTPRERAIVELLARGHTDETAARELDLSRRTVGYALGGLMSRLGVDNRFQLGLALGALRAATPTSRTRD